MSRLAALGRVVVVRWGSGFARTAVDVELGQNKVWKEPRGDPVSIGSRPVTVRCGNSEGASSRSLRLREDCSSLRWYTCGPTVYDHAHLGHARAYVAFDIIRRILMRWAAVDVWYAMGVTDVDDKIRRRAKEHKTEWRTFARHFEAEFFDDMASLGVLPPDSVLRVTEHISQVQALVSSLLETGYAYKSANGDIFFDVNRCRNGYGRLDPSRASTVEPMSDAPDGLKRAKRDFALWKACSATPDEEPYWKNGDGTVGRPGWHIECSALINHLFGYMIDVHSGGIDLRFPHHENEIAQSEAYHNCTQWCNYWLHAGHLHIEGHKMSKSLKNFITIKGYLASGGSADQFRMFCLMHHYSKSVDLGEERLRKASVLLHDLKTATNRLRGTEMISSGEAPTDQGERDETAKRLRAALSEAHSAFTNALADDFDTPRAMSILHGLSKHSNHIDAANLSRDSQLARTAMASFIEESLDGLGFTSSHRHPSVESSSTRASDVAHCAVSFRSTMRLLGLEKSLPADTLRRRILTACDHFRTDLKAAQVLLEDLPNGTCRWHWEDHNVKESRQ